MNFIKNLDSNFFSIYPSGHNEGFIFMDMHSWARTILFPDYSDKLNDQNLKIFLDGSFVHLFLPKTLKAKKLNGPDMLINLINEKDNLLFLGPEEKLITRFEEKIKNQKTVKVKSLSLPILKDPEKFDTQTIIKRIEGEGIKDVIIILGCPKQEILLSNLIKEMKSSGYKLYALGAAFNFILGIEKRAPKIFQELRLEWVYRFIKNPKKQGKRIWLILKAISRRTRL